MGKNLAESGKRTWKKERWLPYHTELNYAYRYHGNNSRDDLLLAEKRAEVELIFLVDLPPLEFFENLSLSYEPVVFFETLVSCIKNNILSHQANLFKLRSSKTNRLNKRMANLKMDFENNSAEFLLAERELLLLVENALKGTVA